VATCRRAPTTKCSTGGEAGFPPPRFRPPERVGSADNKKRLTRAELARVRRCRPKECYSALLINSP
jgi:hypothetical protein